MNGKKTRKMRNGKRTCYKAMTALGSAAILSAMPWNTAAANGEETMPQMGTVVVTATRQAENIATVPANITVISQSRIANSTAETVPELLRTVEGVMINDITGNGRNFTVDLRGFGETAGVNTLVLIDGRRINQVDLSSTDWTLVPLKQVERIEIVRGSRGSILYGDNAAGGVINIITKKGKETNYTGHLAAGSYRTLHTNAGINGSTERFSYAISGNYQESDGYRDNSEIDAKNAGLNLQYFATDSFSLDLSGGYHEDDVRMPGGITQTDFNNGVTRTASLHPNDNAYTQDNFLQAIPKFYFTDESFIKLDASFRHRKSDSFISFSSGSSLYGAAIDTYILSPQIVLKEKLFGHQSNLTLGFDFNKSEWGAHNEAVFFGAPSSLTAEMDLTKKGAYAHEEFFVTDKLLLSGGVRLERAKYEFPPSASTAEADIDEELYTAGVTYRFTGQLSSFVSYSKNFRYPLLDELFNIFTNTFNTELTSQTGDDLEAGVLYQAEGGTIFGLTIFRTKTENEIFYDIANFRNANLDGDTVRQGVELKAGKTLAGVQLFGSYTYRDTEIDGGQFDGKVVPNVPKHQFTVGADTSPCTNVHLSLNGSYIGERFFISDSLNTHDKQEDFFYLTGKVSYALSKGSIYLAMNNLLNEKYSEFGVLEFTGDEGFYPSPTFNFLVGVNLRF